MPGDYLGAFFDSSVFTSINNGAIAKRLHRSEDWGKALGLGSSYPTAVDP